MEWSGQDEYLAAEDLTWTSKTTGKHAGEFRMAGNLAFLKIFDAGHMMPYDQPEHALDMINLWIHGHGQSFNE